MNLFIDNLRKKFRETVVSTTTTVPTIGNASSDDIQQISSIDSSNRSGSSNETINSSVRSDIISESTDPNSGRATSNINVNINPSNTSVSNTNTLNPSSTSQPTSQPTPVKTNNSNIWLYILIPIVLIIIIAIIYFYYTRKNNKQ